MNKVGKFLSFVDVYQMEYRTEGIQEADTMFKRTELHANLVHASYILNTFTTANLSHSALFMLWSLCLSSTYYNPMLTSELQVSRLIPWPDSLTPGLWASSLLCVTDHVKGSTTMWLWVGQDAEPRKHGQYPDFLHFQ